MSRGEIMRLRIFIVCESLVIKDIVQKYISADYEGAIADFTRSPRDAPGLLGKKKYDVVFTGLEMKGINGPEIREFMLKSGVNRETPVIMMTSTDNEAQRMRLAGQGIHHILPIPFSSLDFRQLIHKVLHRESSEVSRFNVRTRAIIQSGEGQISADIVHIRTDSVVCAFASREDMGHLKNPSHISLQFPADYGRAIVIHMGGDLSETEEKSPQQLRLTLKVVWKTFELSTATKKTLKMSLGGPGNDVLKKLDHFSGMNNSLSEENKKLRDSLNALIFEKQRLEHRILQQKKKLSELGKTGYDAQIRDVSLSSMTNEPPKASEEPSKLSMFRRLIEDNVLLRKNDA
ncbi:MAG: hypothetical protein B6245_11995 [Desulfobacteraceae bacterium 4572_88]|nr:MAG: hypothetical protein B6245_11995 [Desulfobacteraceae bacterium 4572_88]